MAKENPKKPQEAGEEKAAGAPGREDTARNNSEGAAQFMKDKRKRTRVASKSFEAVPRESRPRPEGSTARNVENGRDSENSRPDHNNDRPRRDDKDFRPREDRPRRDDRDSRENNDRPRRDNKDFQQQEDRPRRDDRDSRDGENRERRNHGNYDNRGDNRGPRRDDDRRRNEGDSRERRSFNPNFTKDNKPVSKDPERRWEKRDGSFGKEGRSNYGDRKPSYNSDDKWNRTDFDPSRERSQGDRKPYNRDNKFGGRNTSGENRSSSRYDKERSPRYGQGRPEDRTSGRQDDRRGSGFDAKKPFGKKPYEKKIPAGKNFGDNYPKFPAPKVEKEMRLNRYIAMSGVSSRRDADELIRSGQVSVNGVVVTELGTKIKPGDEVRFNEKVIQGEKKIYIVMNKPKGFVTTLDDPHADKTVIDLVKNTVSERVYPVGRLDKNSLGVLLITNDGDLTTRLTHPSYNKKKIYQVTLDKPLTRAHMDQIAEGITLEDGEIHADEISYVKDSKREVGVEIHSGRNRIVRRIFEHLGYKVTKLDRVYFAGLTKKNLKRGAWRFLSPREVDMLMSGKYE